MKNRRRAEISDSESSDNASNQSDKSDSEVDKSRRGSSSDSDELQTPTAAPSHSHANPKATVPANKLEEYLLQNSELWQINVEDVLSKGDDVCILEIPKTIDPNEFIGKSISYERRTKVKIEGVKYVIEPSSDTMKPLNLLTKSLYSIIPVAHLKVREHIRHKHKSEPVDVGKFKPLLPENLKVRHPLFGSEFKKKIILDEAIQEKLNKSIEKALKKMKKKKHKERSDREEITSVQTSHSLETRDNEDLMDPESLFAPLKSDTKIKSFNDEKIFDPSDTHHSRKKHKKLKMGGDLEGTSYASVTTDNDEEKYFLSPNERKKKKQKNQHMHEESYLQPTSSFLDVNSKGVEDVKPKYSSNKKKRIINSTIISDLKLPSFECDLSNILHKGQMDDNGSRQEDDMTSVKKLDQHMATKTKKQKKDTIFDDFANEHNEHNSVQSKTKRKKNDDLSVNNESFNDVLSETDNEITIKGKKYKHGSMVDQELFNRIVEYRSPEIIIEEKKKSRRSDESAGSSPQKKHKDDAEISHKTNNLISNLLNKVKREMDGSLKKKNEKGG